MIEISIIRDYEVVWEKEIKTIGDCKRKAYDYAKYLETQEPNHNVMVSMEQRFKNLCKEDELVNFCHKVAIGATTAVVCNPTFAYATTDVEGINNVADILREILKPIIELLASLGYPAAYGMLITGFIMITLGKKSKGLDVIKWACIGYIGLQFVPFVLSLLEMIGNALRSSI